MADKGTKAKFVFGTVSYTTADCLQAWDFNQSVQDIVYQCSGYDMHLAGTKNVGFSVSLALAATDSTKITGLAPGTHTSIFQANPAGDATTNYIEITSTDVYVLTQNVTAPINGIITMDVTMALNNVTVAGA
jgi:hypothetical protein